MLNRAQLCQRHSSDNSFTISKLGLPSECLFRVIHRFSAVLCGLLRVLHLNIAVLTVQRTRIKPPSANLQSGLLTDTHSKRTYTTTLPFRRRNTSRKAARKASVEARRSVRECVAFCCEAATQSKWHNKWNVPIYASTECCPPLRGRRGFPQTCAEGERR